MGVTGYIKERGEAELLASYIAASMAHNIKAHKHAT